LCWGTISFKKTDELEASPYLRDDRLVIHQCDVTVITGTRASQSEKTCGIQVPPSDLSRDLGRLLDAAKRTDATFKVRGEVVHAHKIVLALRSPVFEAELYGPVGEQADDINRRYGTCYFQSVASVHLHGFVARHG
jgi:speckle-type POZ protein